MMNNFISELYANRIGGADFKNKKEIFKFERIKIARRKVEQECPIRKIIDLGIGEPDEKADNRIIQELSIQAQQKENRGYADNGIDSFKAEVIRYMEKVYHVYDLKMDEVLHNMGSKTALVMCPQAFINQDDITLMTVPGYPIIGTHTEWLGGSVYKLPLYEKNKYFPDLSSIPDEICKRAKILYINYPNNPTGAMATAEFYRSVISFAKQNRIIVVQDAAYGAITLGNRRPLSFLSIEGAKEVGIEIHSMSKAFNMTGWRIGFTIGNADIIRALATVKNNNDSGQFRAIQLAAKVGLEYPEITTQYCEKYERRHKLITQAFRNAGFCVNTAKATFYEYIPIPKGTVDGTIFHNAEEFSMYLIQHASISTVPWDDAGSFFRVSVTFDASDYETERSIAQELEKRLISCNFIL